MPDLKSADLQIANGDAFVNDPAVPKEWLQGRNYTSRCDALLLGSVRPRSTASPDELVLTGSALRRGHRPFLSQHRQPRLRPQRRAVCGLPALREDGI